MEDRQHSEEYEKYINSPAWRMKRVLAIHNAGYKCQRCGFEGGLQVHHKHYDTLGCERVGDLEVLCKQCHLKADRERELASNDRRYEKAFDTWATKVYGDNYEDSPEAWSSFNDWLDRKQDEADW